MWFNILKNEGRRAAYRFFINSMIHQGDLIPPRSEPRTKTTHGNVTFYYFESSNGHFQFKAVYINGLYDSFKLFEAPPDAKPHIDFLDGMFEQEYPEQYAALEKFFEENAPATEQIEEDDSPSPQKKLIRKIMEDWGGFMNNINSFITANLGNVGLSIPSQRYERLLLADINTNIPYKEVRDYINARYGPVPVNLPNATIRGIQSSYAKSIQRKNPDIVWENFINFIVLFRQEYMQHISVMANSRNYTQEDAILDVTYEQMRTLARNIWRNNPDDVETLMSQLPNYN